MPVTIKTIKQYEFEKDKYSFQMEMIVMSKLIHPNIVCFFGLVQQGNCKVLLYNQEYNIIALYPGPFPSFQHRTLKSWEKGLGTRL